MLVSSDGGTCYAIPLVGNMLASTSLLLSSSSSSRFSDLAKTISEFLEQPTTGSYNDKTEVIRMLQNRGIDPISTAVN